jgi:hypothetical protein
VVAWVVEPRSENPRLERYDDDDAGENQKKQQREKQFPCVCIVAIANRSPLFAIWLPPFAFYPPLAYFLK